MEPKFKVARDERMYVTQKYFCNGHWLLNRESANLYWFKPIKGLRNIAHGRYASGISSEPEPACDLDETLTNEVIPKRDGYLKMSADPIGVKFKGPDSDEIMAYVYSFGNDQEIGISPRYVPLLRLGCCFAKDAFSPVLILDGGTLNDGLVGIVMPMRLNGVKRIEAKV